MRHVVGVPDVRCTDSGTVVPESQHMAASVEPAGMGVKTPLNGNLAQQQAGLRSPLATSPSPGAASHHYTELG